MVKELPAKKGWERGSPRQKLHGDVRAQVVSTENVERSKHNRKEVWGSEIDPVCQLKMQVIAGDESIPLLCLQLIGVNPTCLGLPLEVNFYVLSSIGTSFLVRFGVLHLSLIEKHFCFMGHTHLLGCMIGAATLAWINIKKDFSEAALQIDFHLA